MRYPPPMSTVAPAPAGDVPLTVVLESGGFSTTSLCAVLGRILPGCAGRVLPRSAMREVGKGWSAAELTISDSALASLLSAFFLPGARTLRPGHYQRGNRCGRREMESAGRIEEGK